MATGWIKHRHGLLRCALAVFSVNKILPPARGRNGNSKEANVGSVRTKPGTSGIVRCLMLSPPSQDTAYWPTRFYKKTAKIAFFIPTWGCRVGLLWYLYSWNENFANNHQGIFAVIYSQRKLWQKNKTSLIRDVHQNIYTWIENQRNSRRISQKEFLLRVLETVATYNVSDSLFPFTPAVSFSRPIDTRLYTKMFGDAIPFKKR